MYGNICVCVFVVVVCVCVCVNMFIIFFGMIKLMFKTKYSGKLKFAICN